MSQLNTSDRKIAVNQVTTGGQVTMNNIHMLGQVAKTLLYVFFWSFLGTFLVGTLFAIAIFYTRTDVQGAWIYLQALVKPGSEEMHFIWHGMAIHGPAGEVLRNDVILLCRDHILNAMWIGAIFALIASIGISIWVNFYFKKQGKRLAKDKFIRGMKLETPKVLEKKLAKENKQSDFALDGKKIFPKNFEVTHVLLRGTTGVGKSTMLCKMIEWIRSNGHRMVIYDMHRTLVDKFYNPETDIILNPLDDRCPDWDIWCDGFDKSDFENMAQTLIPDHGNSDPFWVNAARDIFASTAYQMMSDPDRSIQKLLEMMLRTDLDKLTEFLKGTDSSSLLEAKKTAISIKSVLATFVKSLRFLVGLNADKDGKPREKFSIREWVKNDQGSGCIFITSDSERHVSLRPLISVWLDIAQRAVMRMDENENRRIFFVKDELASLHKLPQLANNMAQQRKFGGCYILGIQSNAQMREIYGRDATEAIDDLMRTRFQFAQPSELMAREAASGLGSQDIEIAKDNRTIGINAISDRMTIGFQEIPNKPLVTTAEVMSMDSFECYIKVPGTNPVVKVQLQPNHLEKLSEGFVQRPMPNVEYLDNLSNHSQILGIFKNEGEERQKMADLQSQALNSTEPHHQAEEIRQKIIQAKKFEDAENARNGAKKVAKKADKNSGKKGTPTQKKTAPASGKSKKPQTPKTTKNAKPTSEKASKFLSRLEDEGDES